MWRNLEMVFMKRKPLEYEQIGWMYSYPAGRQANSTVCLIVTSFTACMITCTEWLITILSIVLALNYYMALII